MEDGCEANAGARLPPSTAGSVINGSPSKAGLKRSRAPKEQPAGAPCSTSSTDPGPRKRVRVVASKQPLTGTCTHYIARPPSVIEAKDISAEKGPPARTWDFDLDPFQSKAIACLEARENVLVAAHTSAGKTVVAEYAIALSRREQARALYTTPIKALSNQKYRELREAFGNDVGLMTGDVTVSPDASVLVLTTEILRNMLYKGSETLRSVRWVVFDEVHYMRDRERGVVWEESIILLPNHINIVFLSATLSNANEFADWVASLKEKPCHVVSTDVRPTPLVHYVCPPDANALRLVVDESGRFHEDAFEAVHARATACAGLRGGGRGGGLARLLRSIHDRDWLPAIVFCFARRECEGRAVSLAREDFTSADEKRLVREVFDNGLLALAEEDRKLAQVQSILPLLERGIGVHHSGLLPIIKELVELLFQEGLIKVLFATETFALGVNMPARTVVFASLRKFDGISRRLVTSGEYIQMSGRAGRRGRDPVGNCVLFVDSSLSVEDARRVLCGRPSPLVSRFRVTYNLLLNLMRVQTDRPDRVVGRSFHQFQTKRRLPEIEARLSRAEAAKSAVGMSAHGEQGAEYARAARTHANRASELWQRALRGGGDRVAEVLAPGRLVWVAGWPQGDDVTDEAGGGKASSPTPRGPPPSWGWGVVVDYRKRYATPGGICVFVLLACECDDPTGVAPLPSPPTQPDTEAKDANGVHVVGLMTSMIRYVSALRLYMPAEVASRPSRLRLHQAMHNVLREYPLGPPLLDPVRDFAASGPEVKELAEEAARVGELRAARDVHPLHAQLSPAERAALIAEAERTATLSDECARLRAERERTGVSEFQDEVNKRTRVLRRLGHVSTDGVIRRKGRLACDIEAVDELLASELILGGALGNMSPAQVAAFLTCLYPNEERKSGGDAEKAPQDPQLAKAWTSLLAAARRVATVEKECGLQTDVDAYVAAFSCSLVDVTQMWCNGEPFSKVTRMTSLFEGTLVRVLRRLEELLDQLRKAAVGIGDDKLQTTFEAASKALKRGIVFASSLYLE